MSGPAPAHDEPVDLSALTAAIERGDRDTTVELTQTAIDEGLDPQAVLAAMTAAMDEVGRCFAAGEGVYIPEMLIAANAMKRGTALLSPILEQSHIRPEHTAVIGTVKGDLHDIGKDLVAMMWRGADIEVVDLGVNVEAETFVAAAREHSADVVGISALLTTTMMEMKEVVAAFASADMASLPVVIGGAPVDQEFADEIGAHGYARDAAGAVIVARELLASTLRRPGRSLVGGRRRK